MNINHVNGFYNIRVLCYETGFHVPRFSQTQCEPAVVDPAGGWGYPSGVTRGTMGATFF